MLGRLDIGTVHGARAIHDQGDLHGGSVQSQVLKGHVTRGHSVRQNLAGGQVHRLDLDDAIGVVAVGDRQAALIGGTGRDTVELEVSKHRAGQRVVMLPLDQPQVHGGLSIMCGGVVVPRLVCGDARVLRDDLGVVQRALAVNHHAQ